MRTLQKFYEKFRTIHWKMLAIKFFKMFLKQTNCKKPKIQGSNPFLNHFPNTLKGIT